MAQPPQSRKRLVFVAWLALCWPAAALARPDVIAGPLRSALGRADQIGEQGRQQGRQPAARLAVWVYFTDKGLTGSDLQEALAAKARSLTARMAIRRARMRGKGKPLVDTLDLPVSPAYVEAVQRTGAALRRRSRWLDAASFNATDEQIVAMAQLPCVRRIDLVVRHARKAEPEPTSRNGPPSRQRSGKSGQWMLDYGGSLAALEQIDVPRVHEMGITGQGVVIGMLDTGFLTTHEALREIPVLAAYDFVDDDADVTDTPGHGSATLATVMGHADGVLSSPAFSASAILARTEDSSAEYPLEEDNWVAGLEWCESLGADIISSSLGYRDWYSFEDLDGQTAVTTVAADLAVGRGLVVVNSAGNERHTTFDHIIAPADGDSVIAVGAVDSDGIVTGFSSPGPTYDGRIKPDVCALGYENLVPSPGTENEYRLASGTSFACPLAAGVAALVLCRQPSLTPVEVREAMRQTADRAAVPDNDYGWGILDAYAAATYWGPSLVHVPLADRELPAAAYKIATAITDRVSLDPSHLWLHFRVDHGSWQQIRLVADGDDLFEAGLPGQAGVANFAYYLEATDSEGLTARWPAGAPGLPARFTVGPDTQPPILVHQPLDDQPLATWPPVVRATASDNLGISRVDLDYRLEGGPVQGPYHLSTADGDHYQLLFPLEAEVLLTGEQIVYSLTARDAAASANTSVSGPHVFTVVGGSAAVLVIDGDLGAAPLAFTPSAGGSGLVTTQESSAAAVGRWLTDLNLTVDLVGAAEFTTADLAGHQLIVQCLGSNPVPGRDPRVGLALARWADGGGKVLLEGAYLGRLLELNTQQDFARSVLHAAASGTCTGDLVPASGQELHPLLVYPHELPQPLVAVPAVPPIHDWSVLQPDEDSQAIVAPVDCGLGGSILVHEGSEYLLPGQIVSVGLDIRSLPDTLGARLIENAVSFLLATAAKPTGMLAGRVTLTDRNDHSGIEVACSNGSTVMTDRYGLYSFGALREGRYEVRASKPGYAPARQRFLVAANQQLTGADLVLEPFVVHGSRPETAIPDSGLGLASDVISVATADTLRDMAVHIDLSHPRPEDLTVLLEHGSTVVALHDRTSGSGEGIVGDWPASLAVDGPGRLGDFFGQPVAGDWTLTVEDQATGQTGIWHDWSLNFRLSEPAPPVVPPSTRLALIAPNPFNAGTEIVFDLARAGRVRMEIYDLRGRRVRRLLEMVLPAGRYAEPWGGRDDRGRTVGSGLYLVRLSTDGAQDSRKLTVLR